MLTKPNNVHSPTTTRKAAEEKKTPTKSQVAHVTLTPSQSGRSKDPTSQQDVSKHHVASRPAPFSKVIAPRSLKESVGPTAGRVASFARNAPHDIQSTIQNRLKNKSPWYQALMSPLTNGGVKIPDSVGTETGTYRHNQQITVPVNGQGFAGLRVITPYVNTYTGLSGLVTNGCNIQVTGPLSDASSVRWGDGATTTACISLGLNTPALLKANARSHRIVSAMVCAQAETSTLNDAGEMISFSTPFACEPASVSYATIQEKFNSAIVPLNAHKPIVARFYPIESEANYFDGSVMIGGTNDPGNYSYHDFILTNEPSFALPGVVPWEFGVLVSGATVSTGVVRFNVVINYEFIPIKSAALVSAEPSPIDPNEEQLVLNWVQTAPVNQVVSQNFASKSPSDSTVSAQHEPSGLGMFFNLIEEVIPLVGKAAPLLAAL